MTNPLTPAQFAAAYNLAPAAAPVAPSQPQFAPYVTAPGDRWDGIAWRAYGDPTLIAPIIAANPTVAISPVLAPGITIYPDFDSSWMHGRGFPR